MTTDLSNKSEEGMSYTDIQVKDKTLALLRKLTDVPHEHYEGQNGCSICNEDLIEAVARRLEEAQQNIVVLQQQCNFERSRFDRSLNVLMGIYNLLYPQRFSNSDGVTFEFHSPHVHEQMQALSDRIRAIPDSVSELKAESDASHDAKVAAEALEEAANELDDLDIPADDFLLAKAAEYRAKATESGRKE